MCPLYLVGFRDDVHRIVRRHRQTRNGKESRVVAHPRSIFVDRVQVLGVAQRTAKGARRTRGTRRAAGRPIVVGGQQFLDRRVDRRFRHSVALREETTLNGRRGGLIAAAAVRRIVVAHVQRRRRTEETLRFAKGQKFRRRRFLRFEKRRNAMFRPLDVIVENDEQNGNDDENERSHTGDDRVDRRAVDTGRTGGRSGGAGRREIPITDDDFRGNALNERRTRLLEHNLNFVGCLSRRHRRVSPGQIAAGRDGEETIRRAVEKELRRTTRIRVDLDEERSPMMMMRVSLPADRSLLE